jgi:hypothetical protein
MRFQNPTYDRNKRSAFNGKDTTMTDGLEEGEHENETRPTCDQNTAKQSSNTRNYEAWTPAVLPPKTRTE